MRGEDYLRVVLPPGKRQCRVCAGCKGPRRRNDFWCQRCGKKEPPQIGREPGSKE